MNITKLRLELMRAILKSSNVLFYDDIFQYVKDLTMQIAPNIKKIENEKLENLETEKEKLENLKMKKEIK